VYIQNATAVVEHELEQTWCGWSAVGQWCARLLSRPVPERLVSSKLAEQAAEEIPKKLMSLGIDGHVDKRFIADRLVVLRVDVKSIDSSKIISTHVSHLTASWVNGLVEQLGAKGVLDGAIKAQVEKVVVQRLPGEVGKALADLGIIAQIYADEDEHEANTFFALINNELETAAALHS
jgi:hypothetical protein